ncbi:MAG TPA: phospho-sugar mutase [Pirellulales bacterium]|jgi:phosphoglucomutase/phosphomannomutase|nr:phospho-sugar mutase [Pirellulales bacterium]
MTIKSAISEPVSTEAAFKALQSAVLAGKLSAGAVENIRTWLARPQYAAYAPLVLEHIDRQQWQELDDAFWTIIPFGTAGRRGRMYPIGTNAINDRTMGESVQGLADYVLAYLAPGESLGANYGENRLSCAIAYDTRHRSRQFAELSAEIMVANGFEVLFLDGFRPTPELSFTVRHNRCACGIMISASHNPPSDNAIKAFWSTGGQLRSPHDEGVIQCVGCVTEIKRTPYAEAVSAGRIKFCQVESDAGYQAAVLGQATSGPRDLKILYSPLHGVGLTSVLPILQADGFQNIEVFQPHATPDGDFPNVPNHVANPENPAVFDALIEHAKTTGAEIVLASDPDADRIGCAALLKNSERGVRSLESSLSSSNHSNSALRTPHSALPTQHWSTFSGNQIGALLGEFLLGRLKQSGRLTPEHYIIKTLVTSDMICRIAEQFGVRAFGDLLTGFKWIGSKMDEVGPEKFVFGFEEAHGYLAGTYARDKDGAVAAMLLAELAAECKAQGLTLHQRLDALFLQYGCHLEKSINHTLPGADGLAKMKAVMDRLRNNPPRQLGGLDVLQVRDYLRQQALKAADSGQWSVVGDQKALDEVPPSDLLIFDLDPAGNRAAVRPSGTESKLKFYLFAYEPPEKSADLIATKERLRVRLAALEKDLLVASEPRE